MVMGKTLVAIEILQCIKDNARITTMEIAEKTGLSAQYIRNTARVLAELQLVKTPVRGVYVITDLGNHVLNQIRKSS